MIPYTRDYLYGIMGYEFYRLWSLRSADCVTGVMLSR